MYNTFTHGFHREGHFSKQFELEGLNNTFPLENLGLQTFFTKNMFIMALCRLSKKCVGTLLKVKE